MQHTKGESEPLTSRERAMEWWNELGTGSQIFYAWEFFQRKPTDLTGREIETIWNATR
jgi:hypothetical protein